MKIAIVGAGAIGGFMGLRLAQSGQDVTAIARGATAEALHRFGWRVDSGGERLCVPAKVAVDATKVGAQDVVIVAVKGPAMAAVAPMVRALLHQDTAVVAAMNGIAWWFAHHLPALRGAGPLEAVDPGGRIIAAIPAAHVIGCVVHMAASVSEPGVVRHAQGQHFIIGEASGEASARVVRIADAFRAAQFDVATSATIHRDIWYKLWGNMTMNPVSALTGATMDRIVDDPLANQFCLAVMAEAATLGRAIGCPIEQSGVDRQKITRSLGAVRTSMLQDVDAGRPLEIDALLSAVREIGQRMGIATPNLDALTGLARLKARTLGLYPPAPDPTF
jgi:2-dehydropantoate 2-reductase